MSNEEMAQDESLAVERSLGRIEGSQIQILANLETIRRDFQAHQKVDLENLEIISKTITKQREDTERGFREQDELRVRQFNELATKLALMKAESDRAKGAGWAILGILGTAVTFIGGAVIAAISGWFKHAS